MPAISSLFSRKGKKGKKVEEPQYEALPPPPADPPAAPARAGGHWGTVGCTIGPNGADGGGATESQCGL